MTPLPTSLTLRDAPSALERLRQSLAAEDGEVWRIDATPIAQLDTSAIAVLLECARLARAAGRGLEIVGAPARLSGLAHLYGVDGLLGLAAAAAPKAPMPSLDKLVEPVVPTTP